MGSRLALFSKCNLGGAFPVSSQQGLIIVIFTKAVEYFAEKHTAQKIKNPSAGLLKNCTEIECLQSFSLQGEVFCYSGIFIKYTGVSFAGVLEDLRDGA